jgi:protein-S-isoprenylcysteine O-methyltransferase Ste14
VNAPARTRARRIRIDAWPGIVLVAIALAGLLIRVRIYALNRALWSDEALLADALVLAGYAITIWVFRTNRYASRIVEVTPGQQTITTGPYAIVRHPFYVGTLLFYLPTPLALGSYWAALCALPLVWTIVTRIRNEEEVLARDLEGYAAYLAKVGYRLIPRVW